MRFIRITPRDRVVAAFDAPDYEHALGAVGLTLGRIDHGVIRIAEAPLGVAVYEWSLRHRDQDSGEPVQDLGFFILAGRLWGGPALIYGVGPIGDTIDTPPSAPLAVQDGIHFLIDRHAAEEAVEVGLVRRPELTITEGGVRRVIWRFTERPVEGDE